VTAEDKEDFSYRPALKAASWRTWMNIRTFTWMLFGPVLALILLGQVFANNLEYGIGSWEAPSGLPGQMWSQVDDDSNLTDPFFTSNEWRYPWWIIKHPNGHFESTRSFDESPVIEPPRVKHTARCFSTSFGTKHLVHLCEARLLDDNMIDLLIHVKNPAFRDALKMQIRNGEFTCQYWFFLKETAGKANKIWTTKRQQLTLDKKVYRKGDIIKGKTDFECVEQPTDPDPVARWPDRYPMTIQVYGVFKTVVE
jgi:hypothetical protein